MYNKIKQLSKNSQETKEINNIIQKLPKNYDICNEVLSDILKNNNVKIIEEKDFKGSYYNGITNTITLSGREKQKSHMGRPLLVCHECIHTLQPKILHVLNYILSNIELILFIIGLILLVILKKIDIVIISYNIINISNILVRLYIELEAVYKSLGLCQKYISRYLKEQEVTLVIKRYKIMLRLMIIVFIINILFGKLLRLCILNIANIIINSGFPT